MGGFLIPQGKCAPITGGTLGAATAALFRALGAQVLTAAAVSPRRSARQSLSPTI